MNTKIQKYKKNSPKKNREINKKNIPVPCVHGEC